MPTRTGHTGSTLEPRTPAGTYGVRVVCVGVCCMCGRVLYVWACVVCVGVCCMCGHVIY